MRTIKNISTILLASFLLISCESWLDVSPKTEIKEADQFSNEQGFRDAVYGVYTKATTPTLYGDYLTMGLLSAMSGSYSNQTHASGLHHSFTSAMKYEYENATVRTLFNNIWNNSYSNIAHINLILKNVEENRSVLSQDAYNVIKGEMLGLRAYLHFDLFRMFAPAYAHVEDLAEFSIPFRDTYGIKPSKPLTMQEFALRIVEELKEAEGYLKNFTQIDQMHLTESVPGGDDFMMWRQNRFNYYAVKALQARVYLWFGQGGNATTAAKEVIESDKFHFAGTANGPINNAFTSEIIFALYDSKLKDRSNLYFTEISESGTGSVLQTNITYQNTFYATTSGGSTDIRYLNWFGQNGAGYYNKKYWQTDAMPLSISNQIPLIRLGEMYLIAAEGASDPAILNAFKSARAIPQNAVSENLQDEVRKEYIKDLYAEGQVWFYYKRMNILRLPNSTLNANFTFVIPDDEMVYGEY